MKYIWKALFHSEFYSNQNQDNRESCYCSKVCYQQVLSFKLTERVVIEFQRDEAKCPALPNACTCTQDSVGPPGPPGPAVRNHLL